MKAYRDNLQIRKYALLLVIVGISTIAIGVLLFILAHDTDEVSLSIVFMELGLFPFLIFFKVIRMKTLEPLFEVMDEKVNTSDEDIPADEIQHIQIFASFGILVPSKKEYKEIELLIAQPPIPNLTGTIQWITLNKKYKFFMVRDVMELYTQLLKITEDIDVVYTLGWKQLSYKYHYFHDDKKKI